nr:MAG: hypothetical protein [Bacteriophage sp.]
MEHTVKVEVAKTGKVTEAVEFRKKAELGSVRFFNGLPYMEGSN